MASNLLKNLENRDFEVRTNSKDILLSLDKDLWTDQTVSDLVNQVIDPYT